VDIQNRMFVPEGLSTLLEDGKFNVERARLLNKVRVASPLWESLHKRCCPCAAVDALLQHASFCHPVFFHGCRCTRILYLSLLLRHSLSHTGQIAARDRHGGSHLPVQRVHRDGRAGERIYKHPFPPTVPPTAPRTVPSLPRGARPRHLTNRLNRTPNSSDQPKMMEFHYFRSSAQKTACTSSPSSSRCARPAGPAARASTSSSGTRGALILPAAPPPFAGRGLGPSADWRPMRPRGATACAKLRSFAPDAAPRR